MACIYTTAGATHNDFLHGLSYMLLISLFAQEFPTNLNSKDYGEPHHIGHL